MQFRTSITAGSTTITVAFTETEADGGAVLFEAELDVTGAANIIAALAARLAEIADDAAAGFGRRRTFPPPRAE